MIRSTFSSALRLSIFVLVCTGAARGDDLYIDAREVGDGVVFTVSGSIDTTGFPPSLTAGESEINNGLYGVFPEFDYLSFPPPPNQPLLDVYFIELPGFQSFSRPQSSYGGDIPDTWSGDPFYFDPEGSINRFPASSPAGSFIALPRGYASGSPINGKMVFRRDFEVSLATMGLMANPVSFQTEGGRNTIHLFTKTNWLAHPHLMASQSDRRYDGFEGEFWIIHHRKIFERNTAPAYLLLQNWGAPAKSMRLRTFGDHHTGMRVTARSEGRNITAALRAGRYSKKLGTSETSRVVYRLTTERYGAGVMRGGDRSDFVRFKLSANGKSDGGRMEVRYK